MVYIQQVLKAAEAAQTLACVITLMLCHAASGLPKCNALHLDLLISLHTSNMQHDYGSTAVNSACYWFCKSCHSSPRSAITSCCIHSHSSGSCRFPPVLAQQNSMQVLPCLICTQVNPPFWMESLKIVHLYMQMVWVEPTKYTLYAV